MFDTGKFEMSAGMPIDDWEKIVPIRDQILILPDRPKKETKGGIVLPGDLKVPSFRGRVLAVSDMVKSSYEQIPPSCRVMEGDRVIFHWNSTMPTNVENTNSNVLVSINNVLAVVAKSKAAADVVPSEV
jgi:co-chaperonin GroES (HSP10)